MPKRKHDDNGGWTFKIKLPAKPIIRYKDVIVKEEVEVPEPIPLGTENQVEEWCQQWPKGGCEEAGCLWKDGKCVPDLDRILQWRAKMSHGPIPSAPPAAAKPPPYNPAAIPPPLPGAMTDIPMAIPIPVGQPVKDLPPPPPPLGDTASIDAIAQASIDASEKKAAAAVAPLSSSPPVQVPGAFPPSPPPPPPKPVDTPSTDAMKQARADADAKKSVGPSRSDLFEAIRKTKTLRHVDQKARKATVDSPSPIQMALEKAMADRRKAIEENKNEKEDEEW